MPRTRRSSLNCCAQPLALRGELIEQHAPDRARSDDPDRERVRREVQTGVHGAQRARGLAAVDHDGDVALRGALRDRAHVDAGGAERVEHLGRDARRAGHAIADDGEDRQVRVDVDALDLAFLQLALEGPQHDRGGALGLLLRDGAADRVLGAALGDEDDRDALLAQRAEEPVRGAGHADHAGALEVDERHALDAGDALDRQLRVGLRADQRARPSAARRCCGSRWGCRPDRRRHGLRVNHLGAEVRQLHRLVVGERVDHRGIGHAPRIGRQHAVDVRPDVDLRGIAAARRKWRRKSRCRCARAWSARRARSEAMKPVMISVPLKSRRPGPARLARDSRPLDARPPGAPVDDHHAARIDPLHRTARRRRSSKKRWNSCVDQISP